MFLHFLLSGKSITKSRKFLTKFGSGWVKISKKKMVFIFPSFIATTNAAISNETSSTSANTKPFHGALGAGTGPSRF